MGTRAPYAISQTGRRRSTSLDIRPAVTSSPPGSIRQAIVMRNVRTALTGLVFLILATGCANPDEKEEYDIPRDFAAGFADCTAGSTFAASVPFLDVRVRYNVQGSQPDGCRVSMTYESNPNPDWVDKPLLLTLDSQGDFMMEITEAMERCMSTAESRFDCGGPLAQELQP
jgi:hypothetical protein